MANLLFSHSDRGTLAVVGPDRLKWLNGLVTCDVAALKPGQAVWGLSLSSTGKVQSDLWVLALPDRLLVGTAPGTAEKLMAALDKMLIMEDVELADASAEYEWLTLHGPDLDEHGPRVASICSAIAHAKIGLVTPDDMVFLVARGATGSKRALAAVDHEIALGTDADWQAFRIEHGFPLFGFDYDSKHNPHDASLERRAVSWTKGCYLGQEVVCMQDLRGKAKRRLLALSLDASEPVPDGTAVEDGKTGERVGEITSSAFSQHLQAPVAIAAVRAGHEQSASLLVAGSRARVLPLLAR